jgi:hypothetical protein
LSRPLSASCLVFKDLDAVPVKRGLLVDFEDSDRGGIQMLLEPLGLDQPVVRVLGQFNEGPPARPTRRGDGLPAFDDTDPRCRLTDPTDR